MPGLLRPFWLALPARWAREVRVMRDAYPAFEVLDRDPRMDVEPPETVTSGVQVRTWRGIIQPFGPDGTSYGEIGMIIADLLGSRRLGVDVGGVLRHLPGCPGDHALDVLDDGLKELGPMPEEYLIELSYRTPPAHPVVRALNPEITVETFPDMPHPLEPLKGLCILFPPAGHWRWEENTTADYLDYASIFLGKHTIWAKTRERLGIWQGRWIGPETPHDPAWLLEHLRPHDPCRCGLAMRYGKCCRPKDVKRLAASAAGPGAPRR